MAFAVDSEKFEWVDCDLCGGTEFELYSVGKDRQYKQEGTFDYVKCVSCSLVFLNPRPRPEYIPSFYPKDEYYGYTFSSPQTALQKLKDQLKVRVATRYYGYENLLEGKANSSSWPGIYHGIFLPLAFRVFHSRFRRILPYKKGGRVLDIGCGTGDYLLFLKSLGWETWGVEIEESVCRTLEQKGISMHKGDLCSADFPDEYFDWVTLNHSLEHMYNPKQVLLEIERILKPAGSVFIGVPNIDSVQRKLFGRYWYFWGAPIHLYAYSTETLRKLLQSAKLGIYSQKTISGTQGILGSLQYILNHVIGKLKGAKVVNYAVRDNRWLITIFSPLAKLIDKLQKGDCLEVVARKKTVS